MEQKNKDLLLKDLCARLPYGIVVKTTRGNSNLWSVEVCMNEEYICLTEIGSELIENVKPYLRPMSSMTEEEKKEFSIFIGKTETYVQQIRLDADSVANPVIGGYKCVYWGLFDKCIDWLNKKMFDYRGLIPLGLALEAKEGMYKID